MDALRLCTEPMRIDFTSEMFNEIRLFVHAYPVKVGFGGFISHPVLSHTCVMDDNKKMLVLKTEEDFKREIERMVGFIRKSDDLNEAFIYINKPYKIALLNRLNTLLTPREVGNLLSLFWVQTEWPHQNGIRVLNRLFKKANGHLMSTEDERKFKLLPDTVIVYRGLQGSKAKVKAFSWTTDKWRAQWFAKRWETKGSVYRAKVAKKDIYMYTDIRNESEVVVSPYALKEITKL